MEEVDLRIGEAKKSTYEFKRDVVMAGDAAAGISADRVVRCGGVERKGTPRRGLVPLRAGRLQLSLSALPLKAASHACV